jgi:hypothetical protein
MDRSVGMQLALFVRYSRSFWKQLFESSYGFLYPSLKADSNIACRAHAVPLPCHALIHTCHAAPLHCSDSAVSFVKVRVVAGNIRTASPTV